MIISVCFLSFTFKICKNKKNHIFKNTANVYTVHCLFKSYSGNEFPFFQRILGLFSSRVQDDVINLVALHWLKVTKGGGGGPREPPRDPPLRFILLPRAIFPLIFFVIVTLVIVRLSVKKKSQLIRRFPAN